MSEEKSLNDQVQQMVFIQGLLMAMPDLPKYYPQAIGFIDMIDKQVEDYLGNDEKIVVVMRKNGVTRALVLNAKIDFTISSKMIIEGEGPISPVIANYEKNEYKNKLLESTPLQIVKEKYEAMKDTIQEETPSNILSILKETTE